MPDKACLPDEGELKRTERLSQLACFFKHGRGGRADAPVS